MIRMLCRVKILVTVCLSVRPSIRESDNLSKNFGIFMKIGTHIPWHSGKLGIADGRHRTIATPTKRY